MAQFTIEVNSTSALTLVEGTRGCESGRIKSLGLYMSGTTIYYGWLWVEVGLRSGGLTAEFCSVRFFSGHLGNREQKLWIGDYPVSPYDILYMQARSIGNQVVRVNGTIEIGDP